MAANANNGTPGYVPSSPAACPAPGVGAASSSPATVTTGACQASADAALMQPPRNPGPAHHKKAQVGSAAPCATVGVPSAQGASTGEGATGRRRGPTSSSSSNVAAVVAAVAGGGAGPGPPGVGITGTLIETKENLNNEF